MTDAEQIARFIQCRADGWSFNRIAVQLQVSKPTLIKWSRQYRFEIQNLRTTETEALAERIFRQRHERWETLARQLHRVEEELDKRDLKEIPAQRLHAIAAELRAEIARETSAKNELTFAENSSAVPDKERCIFNHEWPA